MDIYIYICPKTIYIYIYVGVSENRVQETYQRVIFSSYVMGDHIERQSLDPNLSDRCLVAYVDAAIHWGGGAL